MAVIVDKYCQFAKRLLKSANLQLAGISLTGIVDSVWPWLLINDVQIYVERSGGLLEWTWLDWIAVDWIGLDFMAAPPMSN